MLKKGVGNSVWPDSRVADGRVALDANYYACVPGLVIFTVLVRFEVSIDYLTGSQYQYDLFSNSSNPPSLIFSCCYYSGQVNIDDPLVLLCISMPRV